MTFEVTVRNLGELNLTLFEVLRRIAPMAHRQRGVFTLDVKEHVAFEVFEKLRDLKLSEDGASDLDFKVKQ